jgi:hypothetical protein
MRNTLHPLRQESAPGCKGCTSYWIHPDRIFSTEYTDTYYNDNMEKIEANSEKAQSYARPLLTRVLETAGLWAANE